MRGVWTFTCVMRSELTFLALGSQTLVCCGDATSFYDGWAVSMLMRFPSSIAFVENPGDGDYYKEHKERRPKKIGPRYWEGRKDRGSSGLYLASTAI